ncbi:MAG: hypothetical protein ACTSRS_05965 [Candidatus Helarchaeota archaeon]
MFYCPNCGTEVEKEGQLCPKCELKSIAVDQQSKTKELLHSLSRTLDTSSHIDEPQTIVAHTELPMAKIFDEIFYVRKYRKNNLYLIAGTFLFVIGFLIWFVWSLFTVWQVYFSYDDPFWFIIIGVSVGGILAIIWIIRANDIKRGIPYTLRPRKKLKKYRIFRRHLYHRFGLVPKTYYDPNINIEEKEKDLLLWASEKRLSIGFKILQYVIVTLLCLVATILINQFSSFFGLLLTPLNILIFLILIGIFSIVPNSIRKYYCLSPIYFTHWILKKWMTKKMDEPYGLYFKPLYVNLQLITKNYLNLEIKEINEIVANLFAYFIIHKEHDIEASIEIDASLRECLKMINNFIENYAINHVQYLKKTKRERDQFNDALDKALEAFFFRFLLIMDDIQRFNETQIGKVSIKFKIDWKQRLWENFSKLLFSAGAASIVTIITGLVSTL